MTNSTTIRCPSCGESQPEAASTCLRCHGSLREIVAGYEDLDELATDREALEGDGWRVVEIRDLDGSPAISVRYQRGDPSQMPRDVARRVERDRLNRARDRARLERTRERNRLRDRDADREVVRPQGPEPTPRGAAPPIVRIVIGTAAVAMIVAAAILAYSLGVRTPSVSSGGGGGSPTLEIGGDGQGFSGSIEGLTAASDKVVGTAPMTYQLAPGRTYMAAIQKSSVAIALLSVTLVCPNGSRFTSATSSPSGIVQLQGQCG